MERREEKRTGGEDKRGPGERDGQKPSESQEGKRQGKGHTYIHTHGDRGRERGGEGLIETRTEGSSRAREKSHPGGDSEREKNRDSETDHSEAEG